MPQQSKFWMEFLESSDKCVFHFYSVTMLHTHRINRSSLIFFLASTDFQLCGSAISYGRALDCQTGPHQCWQSLWHFDHGHCVPSLLIQLRKKSVVCIQVGYPGSPVSWTDCLNITQKTVEICIKPAQKRKQNSKIIKNCW